MRCAPLNNPYTVSLCGNNLLPTDITLKKTADRRLHGWLESGGGDFSHFVTLMPSLVYLLSSFLSSFTVGQNLVPL